MQRPAHRPGACEQFRGHPFDAPAQSRRVQIHAEHVLPAKQLLQAGEVLLPFLHFQRRHDCPQLLQQRIRGGLEFFALVVDAPDIPGISRQHQRQQHQAVHVQPFCLIGLDGLAEPDRELLAGVRGDALGRVRHERIGQTAVQHRVDEVPGLQDAGIHHHGHGLDVAQLRNQPSDVLVRHFGRNQVIPQQASVNGHGRVKGVQAGADLHPLHLVHGLPVHVHHAAQLQGRTAVGVVVFDDQILRLLRVDERRGIGALVREDGIIVFKSVLRQHFLHFLVRAGGDLVDHAPGVGDLGGILHILQEFLRHQSLLGPPGGIGDDGGFHLIPVVGAVVHALEGQGQPPRQEALVQEQCHLSHDQRGLQSALQVCGRYPIALLRDGEGDHLQAGIGENLRQPGPVLLKLGVRLQALRHGGNDLLLDIAVGLQTDQQA